MSHMDEPGTRSPVAGPSRQRRGDVPVAAGTPVAPPTGAASGESTPRRRGFAALGAWARGPLGWVAAGLGTTVLVVLVLVAALGGGARSDREVRDAVALAAGFPAAVTVADGTVVESRALGDRAHTATVEVAGAGDQDAALALLEDGAFTRTGEVERDGVRSYSLVSADLGVTVVLKESGGVPVVTYTVAPRG